MPRFATAIALGVCEPAASGLGGQTMMLIHVPGDRTVALDGSSRAPRHTPSGGLDKKARLRGHRATTVPSTVACLGYALEKFGTLPWSQVVEPAIELAEEGFRISRLLRRLTRRECGHLRRSPAGAVFLAGNGEPWPAGFVLRQPTLSKTLRRLADHGYEDFYTGGIARDIAADMAANDGLIDAEDLADVPRPIEREPMAGTFRSRPYFTLPPPSAGRTLMYVLELLGHLPEMTGPTDSAKTAVIFAETIRRAMLDRQSRPAEPSSFSQAEYEAERGEDLAARVAEEVRTRVKNPAPIETSGETTHLSTMDESGCAVGLTQSIERVYGACTMSPDLGFLYNNYMSAFEHEDSSHPYYLQAGAVPWASVAPTIVMDGDRPGLVLGSPGSERIATAIAQVLLGLESQSLMDAITAPRMHCGADGKVSLEMSRMRSDIPAALRAAGFEVNEVEPFSFYLGCVQAVMREPGGLLGVADLRRDGSAAGV